MCKCSCNDTQVRKVDQSRNGVKVVVTRYYDQNGLVGTSVEADCQCFGIVGRLHTTTECPAYKAAVAKKAADQRAEEWWKRPAFSPEENHKRRMDAKYFRLPR